MAKIRSDKTHENPNYLGWDENHDGDGDEWFNCPNCKENNYIKINDKECDLCRVQLEWVNNT